MSLDALSEDDTGECIDRGSGQRSSVGGRSLSRFQSNGAVAGGFGKWSAGTACQLPRPEFALVGALENQAGV